MKISRPQIAKLMIGISALALTATSTLAEPMPPEQNLAGLEFQPIGRNDLFTYQALPEYHEAPFLDELVKAGKLPPVAERLPKEPLVYKTSSMIDGIGQYGDVFKHVTGGRPEGWNWLAGQHQGWGGVEIIQECLVRQGPRWQIKAEDQTGPLPNLAKSWEWNADKTEVTMHLVEGVRWSDGDPFDTDDIAFWWFDNVEDTNVASRMPAGSFGGGAKMEVIDQYSFKFIFPAPQAETVLENLAYIQGCPGPSHVLKDKHPKYNPEATYDSYTTSMPADQLPIPVLGAFVPVKHLPDELIIMRRNPYFWKVDEAGNQLPYMDEMQFKLTTWDDRTTQAIAGTADFANMENPGNYVEVLKQSQDPNAPVSAKFGPRTQVWRVNLNFSPDIATTDYDKELRNLFRDLRFRQAVSYGIDRDALGQSLARGPFSYPYMGGFASGSPYYDASATFYTPHDVEKSKALLAEIGLKDTDGNNILNLPGTGQDLVIDTSFLSGGAEVRKLTEGIASQLSDVGIRILPKPTDETSLAPAEQSGALNAFVSRTEFILPTRESCKNLPISDTCPYFHLAGPNGREMFPFEADIAKLYEEYNATEDNVRKKEITSEMQRLLTENLYSIGLVQVPSALLVNKRIRNANPSTPVFMYEWAEDGVMRERLWVPKELQGEELMPGTIAEYK